MGIKVDVATSPGRIEYNHKESSGKEFKVVGSSAEINTTAIALTGALTVTGAVAQTGAHTVTGNISTVSTNGATYNIKTIVGTKTCSSGTATETVSSVIPAGVTVLGVVGRVTTILAGSGLTTWSAGETGDLDLWGTTLAVAAGTTFDYSDATANPAGTWTAAARNLIFTAAAGQFDSGVISYCIFYTDNTAPTS